MQNPIVFEKPEVFLSTDYGTKSEKLLLNIYF